MSETGRLLLMSALAVKDPLDALLRETETTRQLAVDTQYEPTAVIERAIAEGARPDIVVCTAPAMERLVTQGVIDPATVQLLAQSSIGVAIVPGAPRPDLSTVDALVAALLAARAVAYSRTGASGQSFARLIDRLGIADRVNARAVVIEKGFVAETLLDGRAELAIQQLSELATVAGVEVVGPLPDGAQDRIVIAAGVATASVDSPAARAVREALGSPRMTRLLAAAHLEPPRRASVE